MNRLSSSLVFGSLFVIGSTVTLATPANDQTAAFVAPTDPVPCAVLPNGGFQDGFSNWTIEPSTGGFGDVSPTADAYLCGDLGPNQICLQASVFVNDVGVGSTGSAGQAKVSASRTVNVSHRYLEFRLTNGGFGTCVFGAPSARIAGKVVLTNPSGRTKDRTFFDISSDLVMPCGPTGVCATYILAPEWVSVDLFEAGFQLGEPVTFEVVWSVTVASLDPCDRGDLGGSIRLDRFRMCDKEVSNSSSVDSQLATFVPVSSSAEAEPYRWPSLLALEPEAHVGERVDMAHRSH